MGWLPILGGDVQIDVADLAVDPRARHYWDGEKRLGTFFAQLTNAGEGAVAWDVFYVYPPDASWGDEPAESGAPVIDQAATLERALKPYLS